MPGIGKRAETETNTNPDQTAEIAQDALMDELINETVTPKTEEEATLLNSAKAIYTQANRVTIQQEEQHPETASNIKKNIIKIGGALAILFGVGATGYSAHELMETGSIAYLAATILSPYISIKGLNEILPDKKKSQGF